MHELSIVLGIVRIAETEAARHQASLVESIELEIGTLAGIEFDALDMVWSSAVKNTVLEKSERIISIIQGQGHCLECDKKFDLDKVYDPCPNCQSNVKGIVQGKELRVKALTL